MKNGTNNQPRLGKRRESRRKAIELLLRWSAGESQVLLDSEIQFNDELCDMELLRQVFRGVIEHKDMLDETIAKFLIDWRLSRLHRTDLTILRIAVFELLHLHSQVPPRTCINEAIELSKEFGSTEKTPGFVNGVLDSIWKHMKREDA